MKKLLLATVLLWPLAAQAADLSVKSPVAASSVLGSCTTTACTGFYAGFGFAGNGTNADIIGSGLTGSVFAGGGIPFIDAGWQLWNGKYFIGAEVGGGYQINTPGSVNGMQSNETGYDFYQEVQVGGTLSSLFGSASAPVTIPTGLTADLIAPYVAIGADERSFGTGWRTGAGAKFALAPTMILDVGYRYINYGSASVGGLNFNAENLVFVKFDVPFR